jgi:hypothetical protein
MRSEGKAALLIAWSLALGVWSGCHSVAPTMPNVAGPRSEPAYPVADGSGRPPATDSSGSPSANDRNGYPPGIDRDAYHVAAGRDGYPAVNRSNPPEEVRGDSTGWPAAPARSSYAATPDRTIYPSTSDRNVWPAAADVNIYPSTTDRNAWPPIADGNVWPAVADEDLSRPSAVENVFAAAESLVPEEPAAEFAPSWVLPPSEGFTDRMSSLPPCSMAMTDRFRMELGNLWSDQKNYYTWPTLRCLALAVGGASVLANTSMDDNFQHWYQKRVRSNSLNETADIVRNFGDGRIMIPAAIAITLTGAMFDNTYLGSEMADFGARTTRAYITGFPTLLLLQYGLGANRPDRAVDASHWKPFSGHSNSASGHAFIGAVPFLTAAQMTDNPYLKGCLFFCSTLPAWSRVNDDMHYLSQIWLGWCIAYVASDAINLTQHENDRFTISPIATPEMVGMTMMYRY